MKFVAITAVLLVALALAVFAQGSVVFSEDGARQARQSGIAHEITHTTQQSRTTQKDSLALDNVLRRELKVGNPTNASDVAAALTRRYPKNVTPQRISHSRKIGSDVRAKQQQKIADECKGYTSPWLKRMCADAVAKNRWMTSVGNRNPQQNRTKSKQYTTVSNVMKTKHDTAKNSISNVR